MPSFASIAKPLHRLTEKLHDFECQVAFEKLKSQLVKSPVLAYPTADGDFTLDTDASHHGLGAFLSQKQDGREHVIAYFSRMLNRAERNYYVTRKELLAVVASVEHFHYYLYGRTFKIRTDHSALQWLTQFKNPEGQLARWIQKRQQYDFQIEHRPGKSHQNADSLSRRPCLKSECKYCDKQEVKEVKTNEDTSCWCQPVRIVQTDRTDVTNENSSNTFTVEELKSAQMNDPDIRRIIT